MSKSLRQCILNIAGTFFLFLGLRDFINVFFMSALPFFLKRFFYDGFSNLRSLLPRSIPSLIVVIVAITFIIWSRKISKEDISETDLSYSTDRSLKYIEGMVIGILLIVESGSHVLSFIGNRLVSFFSLRNSQETISNPELADIAFLSLISNIQVLVLYAACILAGIWFIVRTKRKYGSGREAPDLQKPS